MEWSDLAAVKLFSASLRWTGRAARWLACGAGSGGSLNAHLAHPALQGAQQTFLGDPLVAE